MRKLLPLLFMLFALVMLALLQVIGPISTVAADKAPSVHLQLSSEAISLGESLREEGMFTTFLTSLPLNGAEGEPALPVIRQMVGVPSRQAPKLIVELAEAQSLPTLTQPLEPMPRIEALSAERLFESNIRQSYAPSSTLYARNEWFPANPVTISKPMTLRGQIMRQVAFTPVQVNLATGELRWFAVADVTLEWSKDSLVSLSSSSSFPSSFPSVLARQRTQEGLLTLDPHYDSLLSATLSNYEQAHAWRTPSNALTSPHAGGHDGWIIQLEGRGLFRIPFTELEGAGVPLDNPERLALYYAFSEERQEQAIWIDDDSLYLINTRQHGRWSKKTAYRLEILAEGQTGKRMDELDSPPDEPTTVTSVPYELRFEQDELYDSRQSAVGADNHWYWYRFFVSSLLNTSVFTDTFELPHLVASHPQAAEITMELAPPQIFQTVCHYVRVLVNGVQYAEQGDSCSWNDLSPFDQIMSVPHAELAATDNIFRVEQEYISGVDLLLLNSFTVHYQRSLVIDGPDFFFDDRKRSKGTTFQLTEPTQLSRSPSRVPHSAPSPWLAFEVSNENEPERLTGGTTDGTTFTFGRPDPSNEQYLVTRGDQAHSVDSLQYYADSALRSDPSQTDYIIITPPDFAETLQPLATHRTEQGYSVRVVTTEHIYNDFGAGVMDSQAIREFLKYAYQNWSAPAPAYVVLVGDATYDPFDILESGRQVWLPPMLLNKDLYIGKVAADQGYVTALDKGDSPDDALADMHIGRLPANSVAEAAAMVQKIIAYEDSAEAGDWRERILLTTDNPDAAGDFYALSDESATYFAEKIQVTKAYFAQEDTPYTTSVAVRDKIVEEMNEGLLIIQYIGHGGVTQWASHGGIWSLNRGGTGTGTSDLDLLEPTPRLAMSLPWTSLEGYFIHPGREAISEEMLRLPDRGVIASFAPTGLDVATGVHQLTIGFYEALFDAASPETQLGPLIFHSKMSVVNSSYERLMYTYMLYGDPATHLNTIDRPVNTATPTNQPTNSPVNSPTPTPTNQPTNTPSPTNSPTNSPTPTPTNQPTNTPSPTNSPTNSPTPTPTSTPASDYEFYLPAISR